MEILPPEQIGRFLQEADRAGYLPMFFLELTSGLRRGELPRPTGGGTESENFAQGGGDGRDQVPRSPPHLRHGFAAERGYSPKWSDMGQEWVKRRAAKHLYTRTSPAPR